MDAVSSRFEDIVVSMINQTPYDEQPQSRGEELLLELKKAIEEGSIDVDHLTPEQIASLVDILNHSTT